MASLVWLPGPLLKEIFFLLDWYNASRFSRTFGRIHRLAKGEFWNDRQKKEFGKVIESYYDNQFLDYLKAFVLHQHSLYSPLAHRYQEPDCPIMFDFESTHIRKKADEISYYLVRYLKHSRADEFKVKTKIVSNLDYRELDDHFNDIGLHNLCLFLQSTFHNRYRPPEYASAIHIDHSIDGISAIVSFGRCSIELDLNAVNLFINLGLTLKAINQLYKPSLCGTPLEIYFNYASQDKWF